MKRNEVLDFETGLQALCAAVKGFVQDGNYESCMEPICQAMQRYPHAPQPHNLLGVVLEKLGDHPGAMKHFRAAWALDPSYAPANHNLQIYGTFFSNGRCAFDESDVPPAPPSDLELIYDEQGIGRVVHKTRIEYDRHGIGHIVRR